MTDRLRNTARNHFIENIPITFGYGVCTMEKEDFDFEEGLRIADLKMLEDKQRCRKEGLSTRSGAD